MVSSFIYIYSALILVADLPFFNGYCRYGSDERYYYPSGLIVKTAMACLQYCRDLPKCVAFFFETGVQDESNCLGYIGGPYTYGNGRNNTKCYNMPSGMVNND